MTSAASQAQRTVKTVEITVESDTYQITVGPGITIAAPRATSCDIRRHKASDYD